jgi:hypothetical protein
MTAELEVAGNINKALPLVKQQVLLLSEPTEYGHGFQCGPNSRITVLAKIGNKLLPFPAQDVSH